MLAIAAAQIGLEAHIYAPEPDSPAFAVAAHHTIGAYDDAAALTDFARSVAVVTYEFENVPAEAVAAIEPLCPVRPNGRALAITQDRLHEKQFIRDLGLETAPFLAVDGADDLAAAIAQFGLPSLLKTRRFGYDGKGQVTLREASDAAAAWKAVGRSAILEGVVSFEREVSVIAARGLDGTVVAFDLCENSHKDGILDTTRLPASVRPETAAGARAIGRILAEGLDYVGVIAVELFVVRNGGGERLVVNEIAPRVHNSGHWSIEGAATSQFTQHIRAICGWPLGATDRLGGIVMRNLIGADAAAWHDILREPGGALHLYGKREIRAGRKMGHVTHVRPFGA